jgi:hypothetical protein
MGKMKIKRALAGVLPNKASKKVLLERQATAANDLRGLLLHKSWSSMSRILDKFRNEAVQELGTNGLENRDWLRINHRMELLSDINNEIQAVLNQGDQAAVALAKMKEKSDGR